MSNFFGKATQKVKKKVGQAADRLRPPSQQSKVASPVPSQQIVLTNGQAPDPELQQLESTAATAMDESSIPPKSISVPASSQLSGPTTTSTLSPPPAVPAYAKPPSAPTVFATTGSAVKVLLTAARDGSDLFLPLKAALVGVVALWDLFDRTAEAKVEFMKLESKLVAFKAIAEVQQAEPRALDESLQARLKALALAVQSLWEAVEMKQSRGGFVRGAQSSIDLADIKALVNAISSLLEVFQFESSIAAEKRLGYIIEHLKRPQKVMKMIKSALGDNFVSEAADYEQPSWAGCMAGTRVDILSKFVSWVKDDPMAIFWLAGMAGTGKTSIAVSLCRRLRKDLSVCLGGGYFCSRSAGSIARTDVRHILPTLAVLLADQSQTFAEALAEELENDRNLGHKPVIDQIGPLLRRPLATLASSSRPIVFIIDALDECSSERELAELLKLLADFECETKVKFILTSRPELHIRGTPISNPDHNTILQLHTICVDEVTSDILLYIATTLKDAAPEATWYTDRDIDLLAVLCAGLFIFASTILLYVLDPDDDEDRQDRLHRATSAVATCTATTAAVDKIYELVITEASRLDKVDTIELEKMKPILACILMARAPLSVEALGTLIEIKAGRLRASLRRLHSVVHLPADDKELGLRTLHASFGDYVRERAPQHLRIAGTLGHEVIARGCLRRFSRDDLCFNVSRSRTSFETNSESMFDWISASLVYACLHWAHHIDASSDRSAFDEDIGRNFRSKFLFWLEVLSVLGKVGLASGLLRITGSAVRLPIVLKFLRDANAFVASSHTAISKSAPHIYLSALPFAAKDSLVYRDFMPRYTGVVSSTTFGIDRHGGHLVTTLTGHEADVSSVAYSPDGHLLASGSFDGTVRIWDTRTGDEAMSPLRANNGKVQSVAFAPDGNRVASGGQGRLVHVWSVATGSAALPPLRGHTGWIQSVAFSPDGNFIASASDDKTVRLWSAQTGVEASVMNGHTDWVCAVAFTPDSQMLASTSRDMTIRLWSSQTGAAVGAPLTSLADVVLSLSISPDGKLLAAGCQNSRKIHVWNLETPQSQPIAIMTHLSVQSLAFSPDSSRLVSAGWNRIQSWNPRTGRVFPGSQLAAHSGWIYSVTVSPDGLFLASGSADRTVRIWDAISDVEGSTQPLPAHSSLVTSVAVSSGATFIVSGSSDHSVRIWDTFSGEEKFPPLLAHTAGVLSVAISSDESLIASTVVFSPEGRWLVSGSDDKSVRVWDVATGQIAPFGLLQCEAMILAVDFSPDGWLFAAGDFDGYIHLWLSGSGQPARAPLQTNSKSISSLAFSPDSGRLSSGADDSTVCVWDVGTGHRIFKLEGHIGWVRAVAYSPNGSYIVSASNDKMLRIWDSKTGVLLSTLFGHNNWVRSVAFTQDGQFIESGGEDRTIRTWDVEAALSLQSQTNHNPLDRLGLATLDDDGWLVGSSGELLLWLPADYRGHVQLSPCLALIGSHRVVLTANNLLQWGDQWTSCWSNSAHPVV